VERGFFGEVVDVTEVGETNVEVEVVEGKLAYDEEVVEETGLEVEGEGREVKVEAPEGVCKAGGVAGGDLGETRGRRLATSEIKRSDIRRHIGLTMTAALTCVFLVPH
jgi:hypothetical protein